MDHIVTGSWSKKAAGGEFSWGEGRGSMWQDAPAGRAVPCHGQAAGWLAPVTLPISPAPPWCTYSLHAPC